jgi:protein-tyrosine phosphatase
VVNCTVDCPFCTDIDQATALEVDAGKMSNHIEDPKLSFPAAKQLEASCYGSEQGSSRLEERISVHQKDHVLLQKLRVPVVDERDNQIKNYFDKANNFIESALRENECNRVLIHCKHGQSRSATIAAAWLVAFSSHSVSSALSHLKYCRPKVRPNDGFIQQLHDFESSIISK